MGMVDWTHLLFHRGRKKVVTGPNSHGTVSIRVWLFWVHVELFAWSSNSSSCGRTSFLWEKNGTQRVPPLHHKEVQTTGDTKIADRDRWTDCVVSKAMSHIHALWSVWCQKNLVQRGIKTIHDSLQALSTSGLVHLIALVVYYSLAGGLPLDYEPSMKIRISSENFPILASTPRSAQLYQQTSSLWQTLM